MDIGTAAGVAASGVAVGGFVGAWLTRIYMRGFAQGIQSATVKQHSASLEKISAELAELRGRHEAMSATLMNWHKRGTFPL